MLCSVLSLFISEFMSQGESCLSGGVSRITGAPTLYLDSAGLSWPSFHTTPPSLLEVSFLSLSQNTLNKSSLGEGEILFQLTGSGSSLDEAQ